MLKELIPYTFETASPEECGIPSPSVSAFIERLKSEQLGVEGFMLCRHGKVIARALAEPYKVTDKRHVYSISKSYTGTAIGIARDDGLCGVTDRIVDIFPEYVPENPSENLKKMTIHHLLSMNTGHDADTTGALMSGGGNWAKTFMSLEVAHEPGTKFVYNSGASYMLSAIITKLTGMTLLEYLTPRLFNPLGIKGVWWDACPRGINLGGWGLHVSVRDMLKLGVFYLNGGTWGKMRVVSQDWVTLASSAHSDNSITGGSPDWSCGYCYQLWRCQHNCFRGDGAFGQLIIVSPEKDMVLSLISEDNRFQQLCDAYWETILSCAHDKALPEEPAALAEMGRACVAFGQIPKLSTAITAPLALSFKPGKNDASISEVSIHTDAR
ncbi:MAG: serine hydrolase, partial [Eubacteriales bacterium]